MSVFIRLFNGRNFAPQTATESDIDLSAMVHSIAQLPRWHGHQRRFVSVAEHSVLVALAAAFDLGRPDLGKQALLHDLHESVSGGDVPAPYKRLTEFQGLVEFEKKVAALTRRAFGLPEELDEQVHVADRIVRATEARTNMVGSLEGFGLTELSSRFLALQFWSSEDAERVFLELFRKISVDEAREGAPTWHQRMKRDYPGLVFG